MLKLLAKRFAPLPDYEKFSLPENGEHQQLSSSLLQIENEFYSAIRPKQVARSGETPINALTQRGVEYIEIRCLDNNPFSPAGIDDKTIRFLDAFYFFVSVLTARLATQMNISQLPLTKLVLLTEVESQT